MPQGENEFDDPALKAALKRAFDTGAAPEGLRQRVQSALQSQHRIDQRQRWQRPLYGLAAAAVLIIGFGVAYRTLWNRESPAPQWLAAAMVATHDKCAGMADHHLLAVAADADWSAVHSELINQLGFPIVAAPLGDGWTFAGAGVCEVSGARVAHLLFRRGDETISVFSIPSILLSYSQPAADGTGYSQIEQGHAVSGFVQGGAVHCVIGSSKGKPPTLRYIQQIRDRLRPVVAAGQASALRTCSSH